MKTVHLYVELELVKGRGYVVADRNKKERATEVGGIPVDSSHLLQLQSELLLWKIRGKVKSLIMID